MFVGSNGVAEDTRTFSGMSFSWHLLVGGTVTHKVAIGAGYSRELVPSPSSHDDVIDGDEPNLSDVTFALDSLTAFVDWHPYEEGFHALAEVGFGGFDADRGYGIQSSREASFTAILGAGYDVRLSSELAFGALGQLTWSRPELYEGRKTARLNLLFPSLLLTVAYR